MTIVRPLLLALVLAIPACAEKHPDATREAQPTDASPALTAAHEAYLAGDYVEMGERLKEVIVDPRTGELARDNAFALLESAFDAARGNLPARTRLPSDVKVMTLGVLNGAHQFGAHRMVYLYMRLPEGRAAHVKEMRVTRLPDETILSLADRRGFLKVTHPTKGFDDITIEARNLDVLPDRGAFAIEVAFDDGPGVDTFVLANKMLASAQPELTSPAKTQVIKEAQPEIAWRPFRSPQFVSWEGRSVNLNITRGSTKQDVWTLYKWEPGELANARVAAALEPDSYWLDLMYAEDRVFGGVYLQRATETGHSFSVVR